MSSTHTVTLIPGDGIGPDITRATRRVLEASGAALAFESCDAGVGAERRLGHPVPSGTVECLRRNRVGLKGPLIVERGSPAVVLEDTGERYATPNAALRGVCNAFANVRPVELFPGVPSRFRDTTLNLVIVREVSEGIYVGQERQISADEAEATLRTTRTGSERIARFAFELARKLDRHRVCAVHKANVLNRTDGLFLRTFHDVASRYPERCAEDMMVDAIAAALVRDPAAFDVIVAPNQYGDILSDLTASLAGGLGLGPGGNYGPEIALFEACHGAAPDIAGRGIANPVALILSGAMMLEHLGELDAAERIRQAVREFFAGGEGLPPDLGGSGTTDGVADRLIQLLQH